ncbi:MAG: hypothetical protein QM741_13395 [Rudaea sp.]|uniref:hypothetical protein n=1 Tax=Rudaea sp. TaxID=2136325 RepID=UPI0039E26283
MSKAPFALHHGYAIRAFDWTRINGAGSPALANLAAAYRGTMAEVGTLTAKLESLHGSQDYTQVGRRNLMRDLFATKVVPVLKSATAAIQAADDEIAAIRARPTNSTGPDKADLAAAMVRAEIRSHLRGMDTTARIAMLSRPDALDPQTAQAILEAPSSLTGVSDNQREVLRERAFAASNPGAQKEIDLLHEAIGAVSTAARAAALEGQKHGEFAEHEVAELLGSPTLRQKIEAHIAQGGDAKAA